MKWVVGTGLAGKSPGVAPKLNLRLTYQSQLQVSLHWLILFQPLSTGSPFQIASILPSASADSAAPSAFPSGNLRPQSRLSSAFPVRPAHRRSPMYSRSPKMEKFHFERLDATYQLSRSEYYDYDSPSPEYINIAVDWKAGRQASTQDGQARTKAYDTGFLGQGSSKIAVYVSSEFHGLVCHELATSSTDYLSRHDTLTRNMLSRF